MVIYYIVVDGNCRRVMVFVCMCMCVCVYVLQVYMPFIQDTVFLRY